MKIFYYQRKDKVQNFGDDLNGWLWRKLLPDFVDNGNDKDLLVGFGTLLNNRLKDRLPDSENVFFVSTGAGYEKPLDNLAQNWKFYCVRGPLTARALSLDDELAIVDAAVLAKLFFSKDRTKKHKYSFMPHVNNAIDNEAIWKKICRDLGFNYINPCNSTEDVLGQVARTEILITEAMHGAIIADAFRVPWIPVSTSPKILSFKWQDFCGSLNLDYAPQYIPTIQKSRLKYRWEILRNRNSRKHALNCFRQSHHSFDALMPFRHHHAISSRLMQIAKATVPTLSRESKINEMTIRLQSKIEDLKFDLKRSNQQQKSSLTE